TWCNINIIEPNVMFKMAKKLKILKGHIRVWVKGKRASASNLKKDLKNKLSNIDSLIDKGKVSSAILEDRLDTMNKLAFLENMEFEAPCATRLFIDLEFPNRLSFDQTLSLERHFFKEEIKGAVWDCGLDKLPGPDGFTFGFYRRYWSLLEDEVVEAVNHFYNNGVVTKEVTLLSLL
nr:RNA-directed DNA polymerase, eukaryota, reverse transcriptase zinc-binding domain protein [Tanacetum cinerariifolium]